MRHADQHREDRQGQQRLNHEEEEQGNEGDEGEVQDQELELRLKLSTRAVSVGSAFHACDVNVRIFSCCVDVGAHTSSHTGRLGE